ncbi:hypothetical protein [Streptomyces halobius]|nr:hypothetical protein [Streptomyces halobius]
MSRHRRLTWLKKIDWWGAATVLIMTLIGGFLGITLALHWWEG